ncbi:MAG: DNA mismatch repair endonuclease MutL [Oscillospiraceae bacterium]|nr:DNA mismatch repair endonuclease MutL [Oscillospiraceae bacterium]
MPVINVLDKAVSELIAAGEVIERPSSVIKELVENSIDAGARHITVEIKDGGTSFMRIVDDGCGMAREDVPTAFLRHATSKISEKDDLDSILTLGFRGEALASIAAVAKVTLMTKRPEDAYGTRYEIAGTDSGEPEECGCPDGTTLVIKDLFFNVPARRKFMKRDSAEGAAVSQIVQKIAISHPEIAFRFLRDNKPVFHTDGAGSLLSVIHSVFGREFASGLIPVDSETEGIRVHGYAVRPLFSRPNRSFQTFFVNSRYVRSRALTTALESAYDNMVMVGKFPACVLMLEMPPDSLDVNIHPAKAEVRFADEKRVINAVYFALKNAMQQEGLIYELKAPERDWYAGAPEPVYEQKPLIAEQPAPAPVREPVQEHPVTVPVKPAAPSPEKPAAAPLPAGDMPFGLPQEVAARPVQVSSSAFAEVSPPKVAVSAGEFPMIDASDDTEEFPVEEKPQYTSAPVPPVSAEPAVQELQTEPFPDVKVVGELFANYILAQSGDTFIIIDKHAAHERVIFERLRKENCSQYRQMLLQPCRVLLTSDEFDAMESQTELLERLGFSFDFSRRPYVVTTGAPVFFDGLDLDEIVQELAHNLLLGKINPQSHVLDDMLHEMACKSAIRANDRNSTEELQALAERVCNDDSIRHCPHGRPVMFTMSKYNLERQFRRRV